MDLDAYTCRVPGCKGPRSGVCINGLSFDECPDVIPIEDAVQTEDVRAIAETLPNAGEMVQTGGVSSLDAAACDALLRARGGTVVGVVAELRFNDTRKFGRIWLEKKGAGGEIPSLSRLGPEPLEISSREFVRRIQAKKRLIKPLLLDQTFLAGMGNIYTDEALHMAKLHPVAASDSVTEEQAQALHEAIRKVLKAGIRRNGASIDWAYRGGQFQNYFRVYDQEGKPCPVCGTEIQKIIIGQRGTHFCPQCQSLR